MPKYAKFMKDLLAQREVEGLQNYVILLKSTSLSSQLDFIVLDMKKDRKIPIILGRPFLATAHAMIDVFNKKISFKVGDETITFDIEKSMRFPPLDDDTCHSVDIIDLSILDHVQEILPSEPFDSFLFEPINHHLPTKIISLSDDNEGKQDMINQILGDLEPESEVHRSEKSLPLTIISTIRQNLELVDLEKLLYVDSSLGNEYSWLPILKEADQKEDIMGSDITAHSRFSGNLTETFTRHLGLHKWFKRLVAYAKCNRDSYERENVACSEDGSFLDFSAGLLHLISMAGVDINTLTMEQHLALSRDTQASGVVKPEIGGNVNFEIKSQFMQELREDTFSGNKNEDAHDHVDRVLNSVDRLIPGTVNTWDLLKKAFIQRYCPPSMTAKQLEDIHNFKQESDESLH
ncbi:putative reverse transcriptase domain-containing protein [Tanacetum coccineum]